MSCKHKSPGPKPLLELETFTVLTLGGLTPQAAGTADVPQHEEDTAPRTGLRSQSGCQEKWSVFSSASLPQSKEVTYEQSSAKLSPIMLGTSAQQGLAMLSRTRKVLPQAFTQP